MTGRYTNNVSEILQMGLKASGNEYISTQGPLQDSIVDFWYFYGCLALLTCVGE